MKDKVLQVLSESGDFVSGQALSERFQVSRTTVWFAVKELREEGYEIQAVRNKGYRLIDPTGADVLTEEVIRKEMHTTFIGNPLVVHRSTGSTNADIQAMADMHVREGALVAAREQTAGRGRRGRVWESPPDQNIYMSVLLRPDIPTASAPVITLVSALAVYQASLDLPGSEEVSFGIKWPNDIVGCRDDGEYKKLVGILTEMRLEDLKIRDVTVGIGLNCNQTIFPEELEATASSYCLLLGHRINRAFFIARVWEHFEEDYGVFLKTGDLSGLKEAYEEALVNRGRAVRVLDPAGEYSGKALGITDSGELRVLRDEDGEERQVGTGEISVRGVMGYV